MWTTYHIQYKQNKYKCDIWWAHFIHQSKASPLHFYSENLVSAEMLFSDFMLIFLMNEMLIHRQQRKDNSTWFISQNKFF
jgi:hypothetical protein